MAYRQLFAGFVVLGLAVVGCGGNSTTSVGQTPSNSDAPPGSVDAPPSSSDSSPPSGDQPPSSEEAPPSSPDAPPGGGGGGRLQQLCEDACDVLTALGQCQGAEVDAMASEVCANNGCAAAADSPEVIPCLDQIEALFDCIASLPDVCMPTQEQAQVCQDTVMDFSRCAETVDPGPIDQPPGGPSCTMNGGCQCEDLCASCHCATPGPDGETSCMPLCTTQ